MNLLLILALLTASVVADIKVHYYPYDDCDVSPSVFTILEKGGESRRAQTRAVEDYAAGAYVGVFDLTSGYTLHLFPDNRAMLSSWCDICPTELVAEGVWKIENALVRIDWKNWQLDVQTKKFFVDYHGECESLHLYLCFDEQKVVRQVLLVSRDKEGKAIEFPLVQRTQYEDWKAAADELKKKKG
jgi:hypothetical protein